MARWLYRIAVGLATGITALSALPGHHSLGLFLAGVLSAAGAAGGGAIAEVALPAELRGGGGYLLAALGALAMLLLYALLFPS